MNKIENETSQSDVIVSIILNSKKDKKKMIKEQEIFYKENIEFVNDIIDYYKLIKKEFDYIINEVSGYTLECEYFKIGMIPFLRNIAGILLDSETSIDFKCDEIRVEIGADLGIFEETYDCKGEDVFYCNEKQLNLRRCEIYYKKHKNFPFIHRYGGHGNTRGHELIMSKMKAITNTNTNSKNALFVSNWVKFGPFWVFFVSKLKEETCLRYWEFTDTKERNENYKYFLNTLIENFFEKWLEFIYYGLSYSTINYISDSQAIITASANDMFESRSIPTEHIFTKIANYDYEGSPCRGRIIFTDDISDVVVFSKPVALTIGNVKKIRKMLEMSNEKTCLIAQTFSGNIVGLGDYEKHKGSYLIEFIDKNMWDFSCDGRHIVKYFNGQYRLPENKFNSQLFLKKCDEKFKKYDKKILNIIETASCQKHGTMVIISPRAKEESKALIEEGKGTGIKEKNLINSSRDLVLGLCSIDGAFMIDPFGKCSGIGLILSNPNSGKGNPERGSRYNSAVNYINNNKNSIAVVISEDGMIDIL